MLVSTQNDRLQERFGNEESIRMLAKAGFDAFDISLFNTAQRSESPLSQSGWREYTQKLRKIADECGIVCNQAHAPFPSAMGNETDEDRFGSIVRAMEIASILGARIIVVHPVQYLYHMKNREKNKELNMAFYRRLEPYCEKFNIKVALENMWQVHPQNKKKILGSTCALMEEFCDYLDTLNSPWFVACLDIGHVSLVEEDMVRMIQGLGSRLQALHVHDTDIMNDNHTLPFHERIDYGEVAQALADINYTGDITLEADGFYGRLPADDKEVYQAAATYMCAVARSLRRMVEGKKK